MNDFQFGKKGRKLFTHIKRHRPDIEGDNTFDCLEDYGIQEPYIDLPSDLNTFELNEESSLEAITTELENIVIPPSNDEDNAAEFVNPFVVYIRGAKMLQGNNQTVYIFFTYQFLLNISLSYFIRLIMTLGVMNRYTRVQIGPVKTYYLYSKC